ncbi:MAG: hypothetical protein II607_04430, partial [Bacteroidales bacterium]|nr:hypothetical protein [Bacteroidales bacterium]
RHLNWREALLVHPAAAAVERDVKCFTHRLTVLLIIHYATVCDGLARMSEWATDKGADFGRKNCV